MYNLQFCRRGKGVSTMSTITWMSKYPTDCCSKADRWLRQHLDKYPDNFIFPTRYLSSRLTVFSQLPCPFFMLQHWRPIKVENWSCPLASQAKIATPSDLPGESKVKSNQQCYRKLTAQDVAQDPRWVRSSLPSPPRPWLTLRVWNGTEWGLLQRSEMRGSRKKDPFPKTREQLSWVVQIHSVESLLVESENGRNSVKSSSLSPAFK